MHALHVLHDLLLFLYVRFTFRPHHPSRRDDRGEGVISAAIAVLIMAFLGAAMWAAFSVLFDDASGKISNQVGQIGG